MKETEWIDPKNDVEKPAARVFPRWLSRRIPLFAELEANPLYLFFTGHAYGKRRWWRIGGRPGGFRSGNVRSLRGILVFACFAGALLAFVLGGLSGVGGVGVLLLLFAVVGALSTGSVGSVRSFLEREHKTGRLESLALTSQTSHDWAVAWVGTRLLLRPGLYAVLLVGVIVFWPVVSLFMLHSEPLIRQNVSMADFVVYPSLAAPGFLLVALLYRLGSEIMGLYFELTSLARTSRGAGGMAESIGDLFGKLLYTTVAWGVPVAFGLMGRALGLLVLEIMAGDNASHWQTPVRYGCFGTFYVAASCLIQITVIRTYWRGAREVFLPSFREYVFRLEEQKGESGQWG